MNLSTKCITRYWYFPSFLLDWMNHFEAWLKFRSSSRTAEKSIKLERRVNVKDAKLPRKTPEFLKITAQILEN